MYLQEGRARSAFFYLELQLMQTEGGEVEPPHVIIGAPPPWFAMAISMLCP